MISKKAYIKHLNSLGMKHPAPHSSESYGNYFYRMFRNEFNKQFEAWKSEQIQSAPNDYEIDYSASIVRFPKYKT